MDKQTHDVAIGLVLLLAVLPLPGAAGQADERLLDSIPLRLIGPSSPSGRVWQVVGVPGEPKTFYVCTAQGGVWKTTNFGTTLKQIFDEENGASCGAVAIAPSDSNQIWVGSGEPAARQSVGLGYGVFKSLDEGATWEHLGLEATEEIAAVVIDPTDPETVLVAATGHLWGRNPERGVYKTTDGGATWRKTLYVDDMTGAIDLVMDPKDPRVLYAAMWQRMRSGGWQMRESGPGSGLYRSSDGGDTWTHLTNGLPTDDLSKITLAVANRTPGLVYAFVMSGEPQRRDPQRPGGTRGDGGIFQSDDRGAGTVGRTTDSGGIFRSDDDGASWYRVSDKIASRTYYTHLHLDPNDDQRLWILDLRLWRSDDGGRAWVEHNSRHVHADLHGLWIDPADSDNLVLGGDGGVSTSLDGGETWVQTVLPIGQFYAVDVDDQEPYMVYGGMQETASWVGPSRTYDVEGITAHDWFKVREVGDGMAIHPDPRDPNVIYMVQIIGNLLPHGDLAQNGNTSRLDLRTWTRTELQPSEEWAAARGLGQLRWDWTAPMVLDLGDPDVIYLGANYVVRCRLTAVSPDGAAEHSCEPISQDLSRQQAEPFPAVWEGYHSYGALRSLAQSPVDHDVLWAGADDGPIHVSRDHGATWTQVDAHLPAGHPVWGVVSTIEPSRTGAGVAYVSFDVHYRDGKRPYVYKTADFGQTWTEITSDLPQWGVTYVIREDPHNPRVLYVGTEGGLFVSIDGGTHWMRWRSNLPYTAVRSLAVQARDRELVVGTFGLSIWVADIAPLEQLEAALARPAFLFDVKPVVAYNLRHTYGVTIEELNGDVFFRGENPPYGAVITYYLRDAAPGDLELTISNGGEILRTLAGPGDAGLHQVVWDLEPDADRVAPTLRSRSSDHQTDLPVDPRVRTAAERQRRRRVEPGTYTVTLEAVGESLSRPIEVRVETDGIRWVLPRK